MAAETTTAAGYRLAPRMSRIHESATLRVLKRASELKARGVDVVDFGAGEPDFDSPRVAVDAAREALAKGFTRYTPTDGLPALREALAEHFHRRFGAPWTAGDVIVTVGGKAALFELALALFAAGDEVIIPSPCWVSFPEHVSFAGATPVLVPTSAADGFRLHAETLIAAFTDRTKAVVLNAPTNPTGGVIAEEDLGRLAAACAERDVVLISDETYERFVYEAPPVSAARYAARYPDHVVVVGSFSKTYAMTGWRIGYAFVPKAVGRAVSAIQSHVTSNPTSFAMVGALAALDGAETEVVAMIAEYRRRRDYLVPRLNALTGVECVPPGGAFYAFPRVAELYRPGREDSLTFAQELLDAVAVVVVPGSAFYADDHLRLSFACSTAQLERGLDRIADHLAKHP